MRLWVALYGMTWLVFFEVLLGAWPSPPVVVPYFHIVLGLGIVLLAYNNFAHLRATRVPARVKRIARVTFQLSVATIFFGLLLEIPQGTRWAVLGVSFFQAVLFLHLVLALAIITQAAAVAIAYDMWEDKEFEKETEPGAIPPPAAAT